MFQFELDATLRRTRPRVYRRKCAFFSSGNMSRGICMLKNRCDSTGTWVFRTKNTSARSEFYQRTDTLDKNDWSCVYATCVASIQERKCLEGLLGRSVFPQDYHWPSSSNDEEKNSNLERSRYPVDLPFTRTINGRILRNWFKQPRQPWRWHCW